MRERMDDKMSKLPKIAMGAWAWIVDFCKENGIVFYAYMVLEQGALSGKYNADHAFPADCGRGKVYNPMMPEIEKLTKVLEEIGQSHEISAAQTATAWAVAKGAKGAGESGHEIVTVSAAHSKLSP